MQYTQLWLVLLMLLGVPSVALAEDFSPMPVLILSSGLVLLLALSIYVVLKIRHNLKNNIDRSVHR